MLIKHPGSFMKGILLSVTFFIILGVMFMPWFGDGENALAAADRLFDSISKGSTNYFDSLAKQNDAWKGKQIEVNLKMKEDQAKHAAKIFTSAGATASADKADLKVKGDFGGILAAAIDDSKAMFANQDAGLQKKYGISGKESMYIWWTAFKEMDKDLKRQQKFPEAKFLGEVVKKSVEVSYNFFKIEPESALSKAGILTGSLIFYVIYTLWWGVAILFLFDGLGLEMKAGAKKET